MSVPTTSGVMASLRAEATVSVAPPPMPRVLIVDDEEGIRRVFGEFLDSTANHRGPLRSFRSRDDAHDGGAAVVRPNTGGPEELSIIMAASGEEAIALVRQHHSDPRPIGVAFLDVKLGEGIDGLETAAAIRELDPRIFCTFVTAYTDRRLDEFGTLFGPAHHDEWGYIHKPFTRIEIVQKARQQVTAWRLKRTIEAQTSALQTANRLLNNENQLLERVVAARTAELRSALEAQQQISARLDALLRSQRTLLSVVSHEMRTPLSIVQGNLELLKLAAPTLGGDAAGRIEDMAVATERLTRLVNDTLLLTRERAVLPQRLEGERTLRRLCNEAVIRHRAQGITVVDPPATAQSDPQQMALDADALARVLDCLLQNVPLHAGAATHTWLSIESDPKGLTVLCDDNGRGVGADRREEMFSPFVVGDDTLTRADNRMGLGLAVARKLVADHGGSLTAEASPHGGLRLRLWLPFGISASSDGGT